MVEPVSAALLAAGIEGSFQIGTTAIAYSTIAAYAVIGAASVGGALAIKALGDKQHTDDQQTVKQSLPPRQRIYGRALVAGAYFFFAANGPVLVSGFALCEGPIDGIEQHRFNNQVSPSVTLFGSTGMYPWFDQVVYAAQLGSPNQTVQGAISGEFEWWTPDHRLRGLATAVVKCTIPPDPKDNFKKFFPSGAPSYLALVRGAQVYDPRTGVTAWSRNAALVILDYLTHPRGLNLPLARIDLASFKAMANLCDSTYAIDGTYQLDEEPKDVLSRLLACCDGEIFPLANGTIGLRGGAWTPPTVTITADMIIECQAQRGVDKLAAFNQLRIKIADPNSDYQLTEVENWNDISAQAASGEVLPQDFELPMVQSFVQARRLAKIAMAKGNPAWQLTLTTNLAGLNALGERVVTVIYPDLGIDETFFVNAFAIAQGGATCTMGLGSLGPEAYGLSDGEEGDPPVTPTPPPPRYVPPPVTGLTLTSDLKTIGAGTKVGSIKASVTPPSDATLLLTVQYRAVGEIVWIDMTDVDNVAYTAASPFLQDGAYEVRAAFETFGGTIGPWTDTVQIQFVSGALGPVATALAAGASLDFGRFTEPVSASDDFGCFTEPVAVTIDLGRFV